MKKFIKNLQLTTRVSLIISFVVLIIFIMLTTVVYRIQYKRDMETGNEQMMTSLKDLTASVDVFCDKVKCETKIKWQQEQNEKKIKTGDSTSVDSLSAATAVVATIDKSEKESLIDLILNDENYYKQMKQLFDKKYYSTGYPFLISKEGLFYIHPKNEKQNASDKTFYKLIINNKEKFGHESYMWPEDETGKKKQEYFTYYEPLNAYIVSSVYDEDFDTTRQLLITLTISCVMSVALLILLIVYILMPVKRVVNNVLLVISDLSKGKVVNVDFEYNYDDEFAKVRNNLQGLVKGFNEYSRFAKRIGENDLNTEFELLSQEDVLGHSLLEMKESLKKAHDDEVVRKLEDEQRNWSTLGFAKFGEILRQNNDNMELLSFNIIKNLVEYSGMNQGGIFIYNNDDSNHPILEMTACFAYNRQKFIQKTIEIGEGLVGACYQEGETIYITELPEDYITITSGLGDENPNCLLIVPLKLNEVIYGVIELASFKVIEKYKIEFVEKIGESIASTISSVKVNIRTAQLLEISQQQAEEMRAQEEEMRQNMEEMHATQEEIARKDLTQKEYIDSLLQEIEELKNKK